jgi:hypothetical protein
MRAVALLLVALTLAAGAPRAARAAARVHCCCPPGAHARVARSAAFVRFCPCEARPAPAKPPGAAPIEVPVRPPEDAPAALVTVVTPALLPVAPRVSRPRPEAARAPPLRSSLFHQHVALLV